MHYVEQGVPKYGYYGNYGELVSGFGAYLETVVSPYDTPMHGKT